MPCTKGSRCPTLEPLLFNSRYPHLTNNINSWPPDPIRKKLGVNSPKNMTKVTKYYICLYKRGHVTKSSRCPTLEPLLFNSWYPHLTNNINSWPPDPVRKKLGDSWNLYPLYPLCPCSDFVSQMWGSQWLGGGGGVMFFSHFKLFTTFLEKNFWEYKFLLLRKTIISHLMFSSCFFLCWKYWKVPLHLLVKWGGGFSK